jgi:hypothetical protein
LRPDGAVGSGGHSAPGHSGCFDSGLLIWPSPLFGAWGGISADLFGILIPHCAVDSGVLFVANGNGGKEQECTVSRQRGRPPLKEKDRKSEPVGIRLTKELRDQLEDARRQGNVERSLTQEIVLRLRESFEREKEIERRFGGWGTARLLEILAERIRSIEISTGGIDQPGKPPVPKLRWFDNRFTYDQVRSMIDKVVDHFKPSGRRTIPKLMREPSLKKDAENLGRYNALLALSSWESAASFSKESDVPVLYGKAALSLGRHLKGSPIKELSKYRKQRYGTITQDEVDAANLKNKVHVLIDYLKPWLIEGASISVPEIVKGVTGANQRPVVIQRIMSAAKGKLADPSTNAVVESHLVRIWDSAVKAEKGEQK